MTTTGLYATTSSVGTGPLTLDLPGDANRAPIPDGTYYYVICRQTTSANPYANRWEYGKGVFSGNGTLLTRNAATVLEANVPGYAINPQSGVLANLPAGDSYVVFIAEPPLRGETGGRISVDADGIIRFDETGLGAEDTPGAHASSHATGGTDAITPSSIGAEAVGVAAALVDDLSGVTDASAARMSLGLGNSATLNVGTSAGTVAAGNDSRMSNARTPTAHAASHAAGGSDDIASGLGAFGGDVVFLERFFTTKRAATGTGWTAAFSVESDYERPYISVPEMQYWVLPTLTPRKHYRLVLWVNVSGSADVLQNAEIEVLRNVPGYGGWHKPSAPSQPFSVVRATISGRDNYDYYIDTNVVSIPFSAPDTWVQSDLMDGPYCTDGRIYVRSTKTVELFAIALVVY